MNKRLAFMPEAFEDYLYWQTQDRRTLRRVNELLQAIQRDNFKGIGKPEPLKNSSGLWSRRIDDANRLIYRVNDATIEIVECRSHYGDK